VATPVVIYSAKSTEDTHQSIETQIEDCVTKAVEEGWEIIGKPEDFSDEKFSAYSGNRGPGLEGARRRAAEVAAERGEPCMLVAQAADRFARGAGDKPGAAEHLVEIWHALRRQDVHLRSVEDDWELRDSASVANLGHRSMMESRRKSGAVKKGMKRRVDKGLPVGGKRPYALRIGKAGYEPIQAEIPVIERIFRELREGRPQLHIARDLQNEGVPTLKKGSRWHQGTIAKIARNPIYKGMIMHRGEVLPGAHDPIVDPDLWEEVNDLLTKKAKSSGRGKSRGRPPSGRHLFRKGMLRCVCGESLVPRSHPNRQQAPYERYICYGRHLDTASCGVTPLDRAMIDSSVYSYFEQVGLDVDATREQLAGTRDQKLGEADALLSQAETEEGRAAERLARVRADYLDDNLSANDWADFRDELTLQQRAAEAKVARLSAQVKDIEDWGDLRDAEQETLEKLADLRKAVAGEINDASGVDAVRAALSRLFDGFQLRRIEPGMRVHVELAWKGDYVLEPIVAEGAIVGRTPLQPIFRREPIYGAGSINAQRSPSATPS
jgi:site-specific DNA recombinase